MLSNVKRLYFRGCSQLGGSLKKILDTPSAVCGSSTLEELDCRDVGLCDEDLVAILNFSPELDELNAPNNNFVSLPACIKDSVHLTRLYVSECKNLKRIPECPDGLKILDVKHCENLEDISELPSSVEGVNARKCLSLSRETSIMLWSQVKKEIYELQMVMPRTEIPEWFDFSDKGGNPRFWARGGGNFPIFALALVFRMDLEYYECEEDVDLDLVINGLCCACSKDWGGITCAPDHMLICDLRVLFWKEEWLGLDAFLENDWNQVEVVHKGTELTVSSWGIFMYRSQGTNMEDVQFICPADQFLETDCHDKMRE